MQEPIRPNLLNCLHRSLKIAERKTSSIRLIYIGEFNAQNVKEDRKFLKMLFDANIRIINEGYGVELMTGFGLFYNAHFINLVTGPEDSVNKHLKSLLESFDRTPDVPKVQRMKLLTALHHIKKRYFNQWLCRPATPPILLEKLEPSRDPDEHRRHINTCLMKICRLCDFFRSLPPNMMGAILDNISEVCQQNLPEVNLLEFLLASPALIDLREYSSIYCSVPRMKFYHDIVWPTPGDFVPYDVIGKDKSKKLMYSPDEEGEGEAKGVDDEMREGSTDDDDDDDDKDADEPGAEPAAD